MNHNNIFAWVFMLIFIIFAIGILLFMSKLIEIAESNPCIACAKLTDYVCINKTDIPLFWFPDQEWERIHSEGGLDAK